MKTWTNNELKKLARAMGGYLDENGMMHRRETPATISAAEYERKHPERVQRFTSKRGEKFVNILRADGSVYTQERERNFRRIRIMPEFTE